jgi:hypothetical protein
MTTALFYLPIQEAIWVSIYICFGGILGGRFGGLIGGILANIIIIIYFGMTRLGMWLLQYLIGGVFGHLFVGILYCFTVATPILLRSH